MIKHLLTTLALLCCLTPAWGAIAFDAQTESSQTTGDFSFSHAGAASGVEGIVVFLIQSIGFTDEMDTNGVQYNSVALTELSGSPHCLVTGETGCVYAFHLGVGVAQGTNTVTIDVDATGSDKFAVVYTLTAADDTEWVASNTDINQTSGANPSANLGLGGVTSWVAQACESGLGATIQMSPLTNWLSTTDGVGENDFGGDTGGSHYYDIVASTDVTIGYSAGSNDAVCIGIAIREKAAVGGARRVMVVN